jgi:Acetyltransferase (GNAT) domain
MVEREFPDGTRIVVEQRRTGESEVILKLDGKKVSRTVIIPMLMRIGEAVVRMDGIGGVETEEEFRNRGYMRRVMDTCVDIMKSGDGAISTLFGIDDFYPKFGYATAGPENTVRLPLPEDTTEITPFPAGWSVRPFTLDDLPAVMRLYHQNTKNATAALRRHEEEDEPEWAKQFASKSWRSTRIGTRAWNKLRNVLSPESKDACRVLIDPAGDIAGYAWLGLIENWWMFVRREEFPNSFHITEVFARDPDAADAIVVSCQLWAKEAEGSYDNVDLAIPPEGPVAMAAMYEGGTVLHVNVRRGDFMSRTLNTSRLIRQMQPEFSARIRASGLTSCSRLTFVTDEGEESIFISPDGVTAESGTGERQMAVEIPQDTLGRLCLGAFETSDLLARLPNRPDQQATEILEVLFPKRTPHIYSMDRF